MIPPASERAANASAASQGEFANQPPGATCQCQIGWIELQIVNEAEEPVGELPFTLKLTDGNSVSEKSAALQRWDAIPIGACSLDLSKLWDDLKQAASALK
jgi:hypothetical protein